MAVRPAQQGAVGQVVAQGVVTQSPLLGRGLWIWLSKRQVVHAQAVGSLDHVRGVWFVALVVEHRCGHASSLQARPDGCDALLVCLVRGSTKDARVVDCEARVITRRPFGFVRVLVVFAEALLISVALTYLAEYAGMSLVREAGGAIERRSGSVPSEHSRAERIVMSRETPEQVLNSMSRESTPGISTPSCLSMSLTPPLRLSLGASLTA